VKTRVRGAQDEHVLREFCRGTVAGKSRTIRTRVRALGRERGEGRNEKRECLSGLCLFDVMSSDADISEDG
jgi:hypothetical protein